MKAILEVDTNELRALARTGLLEHATVLHRVDRQRRLLSASLTRATELHLRDLEAFFAETGHYEVPRAGRHAALAKWLSKLKESYVEGNGVDRLRLVESQHPALHLYLTQWAALRRARRPVHAPAWMQGAWSMEFMAAKGRAASQASCEPDEIASAKWVTRWAPARDAFAGRERLDQRIGLAVYDVAQRFRDFRTRAAAHAEARAWTNGSIYDLVAEAAKARPTLLHVDLDRLSKHRLPFWPTRAAWAEKQATWQREPPVER